MNNPVKRHFTGMLDFAGRENRQPFWIWVLICYGVQTALSMIGMVPFIVWMINRMQVMFARGPDAMPGGPEGMLKDMQPLMLGMAYFGLVGAAIFAVMLASAVVRRLHDRNLSGWWALPVLIFNIVSQVSSLSMLASGKLAPDPQHPYANMAAGFGLFQFLALGSLIALVVFLALRGTQGVNRFGPDPLFEL